MAGSAAEPEASITNVQTAGVDEGGIVKRHGDHLVILRRGRLFTVKIGADAIKPVAMIDAYAPDIDPSGAWYDEMLIASNVIAVIGYSYERGGTEIGLFDIDRAGGLKYRATYHLRSNDYYSSRNYASRLIGDKLIFYTPMHLDVSDLGDGDFFPAVRRWHPRAAPSDFKRILPATRIYRTDDELDPGNGIALHTVTTCDLATPQMQCASTAVLGPEGRVFYVSGDSVFVWTTEYPDDDATPARSSVFRIPLAGSAPSALKTSGGPIDQLSFLQDAQGYLNVLLTSESDGEGVWKAESKEGDMALLRVHLREFGDGSTAAKASDYRTLPKVAGDDIQNRYVGEWLIYGTAPNRWNRSENESRTSIPAHALRYATTEAVQTLRVGHGVERIEAMGANAVLAGNAGDDLHFTSLDLRQRAQPATVFVQRNAAQGESRTHGFFYRQDVVDEGKTDQGIVGLPIIGKARNNGMGRYLDESASVLYLGNRGLRLTRMGQLDASGKVSADDGCKASCVDWYGNARPIFIGQRVFALLGYELVEGQVSDEHIRERRRTSFAPPAAARASH
ncbi:MAG: beta-propeller domain-containing protein [Lysobacter sp.]|nr:beta-propeller domain-containing protein [Lysobacter sp.]